MKEHGCQQSRIKWNFLSAKLCELVHVCAMSEDVFTVLNRSVSTLQSSMNIVDGFIHADEEARKI
jgi:hypothetical protein